MGTVLILLMEPRGDDGRRVTAVSNVKVIGGHVGDYGGLSTRLAEQGSFGASVDGLGDLDGDGTPDLAVGSVGPGGQHIPQRMGIVFIILLKPDGSVKREQLISQQHEGGLKGPSVLGDYFGSALTTLVERGQSEEGVVTLVVGAKMDNNRDWAEDGGAVYILTCK